MLEKQKRFAHNFAKTGNGAEAARLAGYSKKSARQTAYRLKKKQEVIEALDRESWFTDHDSRSAKRKATDLLIESFYSSSNSTDKRKAVDALCKLHKLY